VDYRRPRITIRWEICSMYWAQSEKYLGKNCSSSSSENMNSRSSLPLCLTMSTMTVTFRRYEGISKSFWTDPLERELQMVELSATRCSSNTILWVSLVNFASITLCVASQRVFIFVSVYFVIDTVRKLLDAPSYIFQRMRKASWEYS
jgi:hypothetical protein